MAFIILLLYITAIYIRPQEWVFAVYAWPMIDILAISTAFFLVWEISQSKKLFIITPQNTLVLCFLASIVLSHLSHTYAWGAIDSFLKFGRNVIMFFLFVNVLNSKSRLRISIWLIVLLTAILAIQGIYQYQHGFGWAGQPLVQQGKEYGIGRITWLGIFNDPNDLALTFVVAIGFLLSFIFGRTKFLAKIVSIPLASVLMYSLYLTNSRGGYLALAATGAFYFLRRMKNKFFAIIVGGALAFSVIVLGPDERQLFFPTNDNYFSPS